MFIFLKHCSCYLFFSSAKESVEGSQTQLGGQHQLRAPVASSTPVCLCKKKRISSRLSFPISFVLECSCQSSLVTGHLEFNWNQKRGTFPKIINNSLCKLVTSNPPRPRHDPMKTVLHFPEVAADVSVFNPGGG